MTRVLLSAVIATALVCQAPAAGAETLRQAVQSALTSNPAIRASDANMRATAFELMELRREYTPTVRVFGEAGAGRVDDPASLSLADNDTTRFTREIGVAAEYTIFDGYRRANLVYANAARVDGSIFRLLDASETMALNAVEAYIDVHRHRGLLRAARANLARHREIAQQVQDLINGGRLPASDGFQVSDRVIAAELGVLEVERALRDADARYLRVVGNRPDGAMSVPRVRDLPRSADSLAARAAARSYRVRLALSEVEETRYRKGIAEADRQPRVTLNAGVTQGANRAGVRGNETDTFVGIRLNWTLFSGGRKEQTQALDARTAEAMADRDLAVREVSELATRSFNGYRGNSDRARALRRQSQTNDGLVERYKEEFGASKRSLLDVLEAERAAFNVRFELIAAEASLAFSQYRLLAAESRLAQHFGMAASNIAMTPDFESRARARPTDVFNTTIKPLR